MSGDMKTAKQVAVLLISEIDPDDVDAVEDGFDSLAANDFKVPDSIPQHAFHIPPEVWSYSQSVAVFIGGIFAGAIKDVLKARLAKLLTRLLEKRHPLTEQEGEELVKAVDTEGTKLSLPKEHRDRLKGDLGKVLKDEQDPLETSS